MVARPTTLLALGLLVVLLCATGCGKVGSESSAHDGAEARELNVALFQAPASEALVRMIPRFEREHGVNVNVEVLPYAELKSKVEQQFFAQTGAYDVVMADCIWLPSFAARGFLAELDASRASQSGYDFEDLLPSLDDYLARYPAGGQRYGMPFMSNTHMMAYRAPLVEPAARALGVEVPGQDPETAWSWETYLEVARAITERGSSEGVYGTSLQARSGAWLVYEWYSVLFGFIDDSRARITGLPTFGAEAARAMAFYADMYRAAPSAALTWGHEEETSAMCSGLTAMDATSNVELAANLLDESCRPEELRFAYPPTGTTGVGSPDMGGYGLLLSSHSNRVPLASDFVLWAASKPVHMEVVRSGGSPIRLSEIRDEDVLARYPYLSFYDQLIADSVYRARVPGWLELQDVISRQLTSVMLEQQSADSASEAVEQWVRQNIGEGK